MATSVQDKKTVTIGDYVLMGKIGQGAIAEIYRARQESLDRDVAIKILSPKLTSDPDILRRFERESLVIAKLNHPNIVHIIDKGNTGGRYYFVMEYVDGTSLREVMDSESVPMMTQLDIIVSICKALDYAHKNGVIHRDIKPANVLIDRQGNAMVADFGIAQILGTPESEMTSTDVIMGTLAYMSPEQKVSSTNVDKTTDIYAVGVILYEMLVGKKPLGHFKLPGEIEPKTGKKFDNIVLKCLAPESKDRYQTAVELKDAVLEVMNRDQVAPDRDDFSLSGSESIMGQCRYLDTIKETRFNSTILVENKLNKKLYVIKKHNKGELGRKEAKLLKSLRHENIITIHGAGGDPKSTVIISEYAQGGSLADRMARKSDWKKAFGIILQVASGLDFAHKNNIVHGNLRPSNVLFDADDVVKLTDFGMPGHYDSPGKRNWYSPPERKQSRQGDIYAVGVIFHQMLTDRNPSYDSGNNLRLDDVRSLLPDDVCAIISKLLAIRVSYRYKTCEAFLCDWEEMNRLIEDRVVRRIVKTQAPRPEKQIPVWAYVLMGLGVFALVLALFYFGGHLS